MSNSDEILQLLIEIRDNQRESLRRQDEHLEIARQQLERARTQLTESIALQREAMAKARTIGRIALPAILVCIGLIVYLIVRYL